MRFGRPFRALSLCVPLPGPKPGRSPGLFSVRPSGDWSRPEKMSKLHIVEQSVLLELKSVESLLPVHAKQVLTYIKLANLRVGYLLNFGETHFKSGIRR